MKYRQEPREIEGYPSGIGYIISNEVAERFSFYGMKAVLAVFMLEYLHLMQGGGGEMSQAEVTAKVHWFNGAVYLTPLLGALISDLWLGKYRTIMGLSLIYVLGHAVLACMGYGGNSEFLMMLGLGLIALGSGGIKPCVSAHVGDQFGQRNHHLLVHVFHWFYFAINLGALISMLLTPWLLEWYGPHWAFGVPGVLMALATVVFWLGRRKFVHVPAGGLAFLRDLKSGGWWVILKLLPLYACVAVFWALFDQTGSTWVFQSLQMDRNWLGVEWLPSQIQAVNSVLVLVFIPLFSYGLYPLVNRVWRVTPMRKVGVGLAFMVLAFAWVACLQAQIDRGEKPAVVWQVWAFVWLSISEVMVAIVALEYAYTQAPKTMKSVVMCLFLVSVAAGNFMVAGINQWMQLPDPSVWQLEEALSQMPKEWQKDPRTVVLPGYDGKRGTKDDFIQRLSCGTRVAVEIPGQKTFEQASQLILQRVKQGHGGLPSEEEVVGQLEQLRDPWGGVVQYRRVNASEGRLVSAGPDRVLGTQWDLGVNIWLPTVESGPVSSWLDEFRPKESWLARHQPRSGRVGGVTSMQQSRIEIAPFTGGQMRLEGAAYYWVFTGLMVVVTLLFVPYACIYRGEITDRAS